MRCCDTQKYTIVEEHWMTWRMLQTRVISHTQTPTHTRALLFAFSTLSQARTGTDRHKRDTKDARTATMYKSDRLFAEPQTAATSVMYAMDPLIDAGASSSVTQPKVCACEGSQAVPRSLLALLCFCFAFAFALLCSNLS